MSDDASDTPTPASERGYRMLTQLRDIFTLAATQLEGAAPLYYIVHVTDDGDPEIETCNTRDDLRTRLTAIKAALDAELRHQSRPHWLYVFCGARLELQTGPVWQVDDGGQPLLIGDTDGLSAECSSGLVQPGAALPLPEEPAESQSTDEAEPTEQDNTDDVSAQNTAESD